MDPQPIYQAWVALSQVGVALERALDARLQPWKLHAAQGLVLLVLGQHGPQSISQLARFLLQQTQTTTDLIDRLERRGLVERRRHPTDRRVVLVALTDAGRALLADVAGAVGSVGATAFGAIPADDLARVTATAAQVASAAGSIPTTHLRVAAEQFPLGVPHRPGDG